MTGQLGPRPNAVVSSDLKNIMQHHLRLSLRNSKDKHIQLVLFCHSIDFETSIAKPESDVFMLLAGW